MNTDAPQYRESAFRRYEESIKMIVDYWPTPVRIDPNGLANMTVSCRIRDAMKSYAKNKWPSSIDYDRFMKVFPEIVVSIQNGVVVAGAAEKLRKETSLSAKLRPSAEAPEQPVLRTKVSELTVVHSLAILHSFRILQSPSIIEAVSEEQATTFAAFENTYDIATSYNPATKEFTIL